MGPMELSVYYIVFLRKGPAWTAEESPELEALGARHLAHLHQMQVTGKTIASGPVDDEDGDMRGISVYRTATLEEARALAEADPAVRAGRFVVEIHNWYMPAGILPAPAVS